MGSDFGRIKSNTERIKNISTSRTYLMDSTLCVLDGISRVISQKNYHGQDQDTQSCMGTDQNRPRVPPHQLRKKDQNTTGIDRIKVQGRPHGASK